jgi:hypothetical protein
MGRAVKWSPMKPESWSGWFPLKSSPTCSYRWLHCYLQNVPREHLNCTARTQLANCSARCWSYFTSDGQSLCLGVGHPFLAHDQILLLPFFCRKIDLLFVLVRLLWREDGSVICSSICQYSESQRTHNHSFLSHLRLLSSFSVASYDSPRLRWKYSYPPPHGYGLLVLLTELTT